MMPRLLLLTMALLLALSGCDEGSPAGDGDADGDADSIDSAWFEADPEGRVTDGDLAGSAPELIIVTPAALGPAWEAYAVHRELSGRITEVVLIEDVLSSHDGSDDAERLRTYLVGAHAAGARFVLLGGDADQIPFRRVEDAVSVVTGSYSTNGPTQLYFADLDSDWDADGDGVYGEADEDVSLAELREPELHVGRVPAETPTEVDRYRRKVERYELEPGGREAHALVMSDIASSLPLVGEIDAALALEITIDEVFPEPFAANARRLYATEQAASDHGGELITPEGVRAAFAEGYALAFHNGHGAHGWLSDVMDSDLVESLESAVPPVMLSCACLSGNFADVANTPSHGSWFPQNPGQDSAAEHFVLGAGGGVAYVGSTGTGLGPIGGSQMLHAALAGLFVEGLPTLGEALAHGRGHMREVSLHIMGFDMPMTDESERWTQLVTILLGDPSIQPWTSACRSVQVDSPADYGPGYQELTLTVTAGDDGSPVAGAVVVLRKGGDFLLRGVTDDSGAVTFRFIPDGPDDLELMVTGQGILPVRQTIAPRT